MRSTFEDEAIAIAKKSWANHLHLISQPCGKLSELIKIKEADVVLVSLLPVPDQVLAIECI
jgi:hypothetical protein